MFREKLMPLYRDATDLQLALLGFAAFGEYAEMVEEFYPKEYKAFAQRINPVVRSEYAEREAGKIVFAYGESTEHTVEHVLGLLIVRLHDLQE